MSDHEHYHLSILYSSAIKSQSSSSVYSHPIPSQLHSSFPPSHPHPHPPPLHIQPKPQPRLQPQLQQQSMPSPNYHPSPSVALLIAPNGMAPIHPLKRPSWSSPHHLSQDKPVVGQQQPVHDQTTASTPAPASVFSDVSASSPPQRSPNTGQWIPDVYSPAFVSDYQRSINTLQALPVRAMPPPSINFVSYIENFSGKSFLTPLPPLLTDAGGKVVVGAPLSLYGGLSSGGSDRKVSDSGSPQPSRTHYANNEELKPQKYGEIFSSLLQDEILTLNSIIQGYNLYNVHVTVQDPSQFLFQLFIPGIRENTPPVQLGDMIKLRQIRPAPLVYQGVCCFTGYEYQTYVYGMDRAVGYVVLRADGLVLEIGSKFNAIFGVQEHRWDGTKRAIADVGDSLKASESLAEHTIGLDNNSKPSLNSRGINGVTRLAFDNPAEYFSRFGTSDSFLRRMLFPEPYDGKMQYYLNRGVFDTVWFDNELNYEQQKAVDSILKQDYGSIPFVIQGPPGTGKTKTIVEAVLQLIYATRTPRHHILLCAPSQEAADTLAIRLTKHLSPSVLFRLQSSGRTFPEVPAKLLAYSHIVDEMFGIPDWKSLMRFRVIVCSCRDADILVEARCTNRDLGRWEKSVVDSLRGISEDSSEFVEKGETVHLHWTALLLDEAAQGIEPDVIIPLSVVAPPEEASYDRPIVVMAGDQRQLGPITVTKGFLQISAFERLFSRPVYSEHPLRRELYTDCGRTRKKPQFDGITADRKAKMLPYLYPPFANLIRNYRSHPAILAVPSAFFYNDTLVPEAKDTNRFESWKGWTGTRGIPVKFVLNSGLDESHEEGVSFYNLREAQITVKTVQSILNPKKWELEEDGKVPIVQSEIAVMTPFREQVKRLRKAMRAASLKHVNVGPVEAYQGSEYRFVIICTTRARERFLKNDKEKNIGLILEPRRVNVAMTRAKEGLIVIGNPWIMEKDPIWREWMNFAWRHDAVEFDVEESVPQSRDSNKENEDPHKIMSSLPNTSLKKPVSYNSSVASGKSKQVNEWRPRGDDCETSGFISRLETALVYKSKAREGAVFGSNGGWDEDDPMFLAGITAEAAVRIADEECNDGDDDDDDYIMRILWEQERNTSEM